MEGKKFTVLLIENDKDLTDLLQTLLSLKLSAQEVTIIVARHMEEGRELLQRSFADLQALIVDIMLPRNGDELRELERLERERRELLRELKHARIQTGTGADNQIGILRHGIDERDGQIEETQDLEGGVRLLEEVVRGRCEVIAIPTVFFTARGVPGLRRRAEALVQPGLATWIQKPAPASALVEALLRGQERK